jgi:hypothetical protein
VFKPKAAPKPDNPPVRPHEAPYTP